MSVSSWPHYISKRRRMQEIAFEPFSTRNRIVWVGMWPILVWCKRGNVNVIGSGYVTRISLLSIRGTVDMDKFLLDALAFFQAKQDGADQGIRFFVQQLAGNGDYAYSQRDGKGSGGPGSSPETPGNQVVASAQGQVPTTAVAHLYAHRILGFDPKELHAEQFPDAIKDLALGPEAEELLEDLVRWKNNEAWFRARHLPWRSGFILEGEPGNGKTSLLRGLGQILDLPIFLFDLSSFNNTSFRSAWKLMLQSVPCLAAFEDFDSIFEGRTNKTSTRERVGVTFDCLLNCIDGLDRVDGLLLAITTNRIESIDHALGRPVPGSTISTRPGRIDKVIHLGNPDANGRRKIAQRILAGSDADIEAIVAQGENDSGAQFQRRCQDLAFVHFWKSSAPLSLTQN
jgi:hypothetical protein